MPLHREADFDQFLRVLTREKAPEHLPFYEHIASPEFMTARTGVPFNRLGPAEDGFWEAYVDFWLGMGYDEIPMEIPPNLPLKHHEDSTGKASHGSESTRTIASMEDFECYPWPHPSTPLDFSHFEKVAKLLPDGAKIVGGVAAGPYEWATYLLGVQGLAMAVFEEPGLVRAVFDKLAETHLAGLRQIATMEAVGALRQGDDLGFKTSTFLPPELLREYVFPIYTQMVETAHAAGKPFILHSCGNLDAVYDDLIDGCGIDAKHSFEEVIRPVTDFKRQYGHKVTALGGLDVDIICRADENELRAYARRIIEACFEDGWWALGTGNSLTDYMPVENYLIVLDEGMKVAG